jgi:hypothetical protein
MAERTSDAKHGGFPGQRAENRLADDWPIYVAFMPAVVIGIAAAICFSTASLHDRTLSNAAGVRSTQGDTDNYVEGLARLGIAKLPGYDPPPIVDSGPRSADPIDTGVCAPLMTRVIASDGAC